MEFAFIFGNQYILPVSPVLESFHELHDADSIPRKITRTPISGASGRFGAASTQQCVRLRTFFHQSPNEEAALFQFEDGVNRSCSVSAHHVQIFEARSNSPVRIILMV